MMLPLPSPEFMPNSRLKLDSAPSPSAVSLPRTLISTPSKSSRSLKFVTPARASGP